MSSDERGEDALQAPPMPDVLLSENLEAAALVAIAYHSNPGVAETSEAGLAVCVTLC